MVVDDDYSIFVNICCELTLLALLPFFAPKIGKMLINDEMVRTPFKFHNTVDGSI